MTTAVLKAENRKVAKIPTPIVLDTDAFEYGGIKLTHIESREGWLDLVSNYNGPDKYESRIDSSRNKLSNLFLQ